MKIAVIGAGNVGGALGRRWAEDGHEVFFGVRNVNDEKVKTLLTSHKMEDAGVQRARSHCGSIGGGNCHALGF